MKLYDAGLFILMGVLVACIIGGLVSVQYLGDDNIIEEVAEEIVQSQTGSDMDLTPKSPE